MIRYFIVFIVSLWSIGSHAQTDLIKKNTLSLELGGTGFLYSLNYDRILLINENMRFTGNVGTWFIPSVKDYLDFNIVGVTAGASTLFGKSKHFAEVGVNISYFYMRDYENNIYHTVLQPIRLGYRYQNDEGGWFFRAALMPIINVIEDKEVEIFYPVTPHFSASIGYSF